MRGGWRTNCAVVLRARGRVGRPACAADVDTSMPLDPRLRQRALLWNDRLEVLQGNTKREKISENPKKVNELQRKRTCQSVRQVRKPRHWSQRPQLAANTLPSTDPPHNVGQAVHVRCTYNPTTLERWASTRQPKCVAYAQKQETSAQASDSYRRKRRNGLGGGGRIDLLGRSLGLPRLATWS